MEHKALGLAIRMVNYKGSVKFCYCEEDEDGYVERVRPADTPELVGKDAQELKELVQELLVAVGKSCVILNSSNRKELVRVDLGE